MQVSFWCRRLAKIPGSSGARHDVKNGMPDYHGENAAVRNSDGREKHTQNSGPNTAAFSLVQMRDAEHQRRCNDCRPTGKPGAKKSGNHESAKDELFADSRGQSQ